MLLARKPVAFCIRWRYVILALWALPWLIAGQHHAYPHGDWIWVEMGSRILAHIHAPSSAGASLHVYADNAVVQMGPPALLAAAPLQWLPPQVEAHLAADIMSLLALPALWCAELAASAKGIRAWMRGRSLLAGLVVVPIWALEAQQWGHIDDVIALLATMVAIVLVSRGRHEVLAGLILGTGVAAKPWAVILLPVLLAYPRPKIGRSVLAFVVGALAWWAPFVVAAPGTVHALGSLSMNMVNHPTWHLVGVTGRAPSWIRPLQLGGGMVLSAVLVRRAGWAAVPIVVLAWRVTTDPYDWPYYMLGPLLGAALWDVVRQPRTRLAALPWATLAAFAVEFWIPREIPAVAAVIRLAWFLGLTGVVLVAGRSVRGGRAQRQTGTKRSGAVPSRQSVAAAAPTAAEALP